MIHILIKEDSKIKNLKDLKEGLKTLGVTTCFEDLTCRLEVTNIRDVEVSLKDFMDLVNDCDIVEKVVLV